MIGVLRRGVIAQIMDRLDFDVSEDPGAMMLIVTRRCDGKQMRVPRPLTVDNPIALILQLFRDYDASRATPDHWMAL